MPLLTALYECLTLLSYLTPDVTEGSWRVLADDLRANAVQEYVQKTVEFLQNEDTPQPQRDEDDYEAPSEAKSQMIKYERLADFIEHGIRRVGRLWRRDLLAG